MFAGDSGFIAILRGPDFRWVFVNQAFERLFPGHSAIGETVRSTFPEAERERLLAAERVAREAAEGAGVLIAVRDAGIGLPEGAVELIFEPFGRAPNAATSRLPGMGLGLFICRSIAERHGGGIRAESAGEGQGPTVTCWLPCAGPLAVGSRGR